MTGPRLHRRAFTADEAASVRRLDCAKYSRCLGVAAAKGWHGFACGVGCYVQPDDEQRARDTIGLIALAHVLGVDDNAAKGE